MPAIDSVVGVSLARWRNTRSAKSPHSLGTVLTEIGERPCPPTVDGQDNFFFFKAVWQEGAA